MIADLTIDDFVSYLRDDNDIQLDLEIDPEARKHIHEQIIDLSVINLGGRGIRMTVEKLISEPVSKFIFKKASDFNKTSEQGTIMPRFKGKLVLQGKSLVIIDA